MKFEWDEDKAAANLRKHGISFAEASTAFADDLSLTGDGIKLEFRRNFHYRS